MLDKVAGCDEQIGEGVAALSSGQLVNLRLCVGFDRDSSMVRCPWSVAGLGLRVVLARLRFA